MWKYVIKGVLLGGLLGAIGGFIVFVADHVFIFTNIPSWWPFSLLALVLIFCPIGLAIGSLLGAAVGISIGLGDTT